MNAFTLETRIIDDSIAMNIKENTYQLDSVGNIINIHSGRYIHPHNNTKGYPCVNLRLKDGRNNSFLLHRLLMKTFNPIKNSQNYDIDHKNCKVDDYSFMNLEWVDRKENISRAINNGLFPMGENAGTAKLSNDDARYVCELIYQGVHIDTIESLLKEKLSAKNITCNCRRVIHSILYREKWKSISKDYIFPQDKNIS